MNFEYSELQEDIRRGVREVTSQVMMKNIGENVIVKKNIRKNLLTQ